MPGEQPTMAGETNESMATSPTRHREAIDFEAYLAKKRTPRYRELLDVAGGLKKNGRPAPPAR